MSDSPFATPVRRPRAGRAARERRLDAKVRAAERLRMAVMHAALDAIVISRRDGRIVEVNPAAERMFGAPAATLAGRAMADLIAMPPGLMAGAEARDIRGVLGRRLTLDAVRADGGTFPAEIAVQRVCRGERTSFAVFVRDLSAERRAAATLDEERQRLSQVEKLSAMGSLLAGVAHELNNPLAILVAQATLLREKAPDEDVARRAERIHAAAQRAGRIVKSFLALARDKPQRKQRTDLTAVLDDALALTGYGLRSAGIAVERRGPAALPPVEVDRDLMGQVFASLLINAQEALLRRPDGRRLKVVAVALPDRVSVVVEDNAGGVAPAVLPRLFDPYATTKPAGTGLGIGLSLCRSVLEAHGGTIAYRAGREGAAFEVSLPRQAMAAERPAAPDGARALAVLVVDDEADVAASLAELIELFGHRVTVETQPAAALDRLRAVPFDMVFTDLRMPGMDGLALRRAIAALDAGLAARTVLMTGDTVQRTAAAEHPPDEPGALVLDKPFSAAGVKALLDRVSPR